MEHLISPQDYETFQQNTHLNATRDFNYEKSKLDRSTSSKNETITAESSSLDYSPCNNEFEEDKTVPQCTITKRSWRKTMPVPTPIQSSYLNIYISDCEENIAKLYSLNNINVN
nr:unnamed protein product [Callosobruchus analis]